MRKNKEGAMTPLRPFLLDDDLEKTKGDASTNSATDFNERISIKRQRIKNLLFGEFILGEASF